MNAAFWLGRRVFVTGHTGFKGGWLCLWLQQLGAHVTGYALAPPTKPSLFIEAGVATGMTSVFGDIRDGKFLADKMRESSSEIVIHMAAQPLVRRSYKEPVETYSTNVMGTVNVFEAIRQSPSVRAVVNVTTDKCYENKEWIWGYRENDPMGGFDPYSSSKGCAELVTSAYRNSFFKSTTQHGDQVALASARAGNVIGGGDWAEDRLVPDILRAIQNGESVNIRNPNAVRPWQHVLEPLSGYLTLAERLYVEGQEFSEAFNFGPDEDGARNVQWIVDQLTKNWGESAKWHLDSDAHPHEAYYLKLDCTKARELLDWRPRWTLSSALDSIIYWHKAHQNKLDMRVICLQQINEYLTTL